MTTRKRGYYSNSGNSDVYNYQDVKDLLERCLHYTPQSINVDRILDAPSVAESAVKLMGEVVALLQELHEVVQLYEIGDTLHNGEVRKLDVLLNGPEGAAKKPRLIDIVKQVEGENWKLVRSDKTMTNQKEADVGNGKVSGCVVILLGPDGNYRAMGHDFDDFNPLHDNDLYEVQRGRAKKMLWRNFIKEWVDDDGLAKLFTEVNKGINAEEYYLYQLEKEGYEVLDQEVKLGE